MYRTKVLINFLDVVPVNRNTAALVAPRQDLNCQHILIMVSKCFRLFVKKKKDILNSISKSVVVNFIQLTKDRLNK